MDVMAGLQAAMVAGVDVPVDGSHSSGRTSFCESDIVVGSPVASDTAVSRSTSSR